MQSPREPRLPGVEERRAALATPWPSRLPSETQEVEELRGCDLLGALLPLQHRRRELALFAVHLETRLLDRALGDDAIHRHRLGLAHAVCTSRSLLLGRRVPPRI